jgi:hypothetical protein
MTDTHQVDDGELVNSEENSVIAVVRCGPDGQALAEE